MKLYAVLFRLLHKRIAAKRPPDFIVGSPSNPYLLRWYVTPWRGWFSDIAPADRKRWQRAVTWFTKRFLPNLYLHCFMRDDDDRALHDHPSWAISYMLDGAYIEHTIAAGGIYQHTRHDAGSLRFMGTRHAHRIELLREIVDNGTTLVLKTDPAAPCWTLFMFGPTVRDWGFHCPEKGWVPWWEFTKPHKPGEIGRGCD